MRKYSDAYVLHIYLSPALGSDLSNAISPLLQHQSMTLVVVLKPHVFKRLGGGDTGREAMIVPTLTWPLKTISIFIMEDLVGHDMIQSSD